MSVCVRPLTPDERRQLVAARLVAVEYAPYLAHALFSVAANAAQGLELLPSIAAGGCTWIRSECQAGVRRSRAASWSTRSATWYVRMRSEPTRSALHTITTVGMSLVIWR